MRGWMLMTLAALLCLAPSAHAQPLTLCYHYGCSLTTTLEADENALIWLGLRLQQAQTAAEERAALQDAVLMFYQWAARQTPIAADIGGNGEDDRTPGRMDCLDHTHNIHALLAWLEQAGLLQFHRPGPDVFRAPLLVNQHFAASVIELATGQPWVIDGWFRNFGAPPVVVPLAIWKEGFSP